jgi:glutathione S-transferase
MMILRSSPPSPFGRKVKIAAHCLELSDRITIEIADTTNPDDTLRSQNPLGKIPALVLEDGTVLYDSPVILEYLDMLAGGDRIIPAGPLRFPVLTRHALADGVMEAALLQVYEARWRPEEGRSKVWCDHQAAKVARGLDAFEAEAGRFEGEPDIAEIGLACMLGYLDLRFAGAWRGGHPRLVAWLGGFEAAVPSYAATRVTA